MPISEDCKKTIKELRKNRKFERENPRLAWFLINSEILGDRLKNLIEALYRKYFPEKKVIRTIHRNIGRNSASTDWM